MVSGDIIGFEVRDVITGFQGIAIGHVVYISGCNQVLILPPLGTDGKAPEGAWYDDQRVERVEGGRVVELDNSKTPGPDAEPPKRR
jgi:hypothetical protein